MKDEMTPMGEFADAARRWARQTIIFTLQYSFAESQSAADEHAQVTRASDESVEVMSRLWAAASAQSNSPAQSVHHFVRLVLEWSADHLPRTESRTFSLN